MYIIWDYIIDVYTSPMYFIRPCFYSILSQTETKMCHHIFLRQALCYSHKSNKVPLFKAKTKPTRSAE